MEIVVIIVLVVIGIFVVGSLDNARPVSSWSDDKLHRMYGKYLNAASANAGSPKASVGSPGTELEFAL